MKILPIKTKKIYDAYLKEISTLLNAKPNTPKGDRLEILTILVEDYEKRHFPIDPPDPIEAIKFRMEQMDLTRKDLEKCLGSRSRVSEILNHKRELSLNMIKSLHKMFGIPFEALITVA